MDKKNRPSKLLKDKKQSGKSEPVCKMAPAEGISHKETVAANSDILVIAVQQADCSLIKVLLKNCPQTLHEVLWMDLTLIGESAPSTSFTSEPRKKNIIEHASLFQCNLFMNIVTLRASGHKRHSFLNQRKNVCTFLHSPCTGNHSQTFKGTDGGRRGRWEWHSLGKSTWKSGQISVIYYTNVTQKCSWITLPSLYHISTSSSQPTTNRC